MFVSDGGNLGGGDTGTNGSTGQASENPAGTSECNNFARMRESSGTKTTLRKQQIGPGDHQYRHTPSAVCKSCRNRCSPENRHILANSTRRKMFSVSPRWNL